MTYKTYPLDNSIHSQNVLLVNKYNFFGEGASFRTIPLGWLKHITFDNGKPNLIACMILAEILFRYRANIEVDEDGNLQAPKKFFKGDMLQKSYAQLMTLLGISKIEATRHCKRLENGGFIKLHFRHLQFTDNSGNPKMANNVMFIEIFPEKIAEITFPSNESNSTSKSIYNQSNSTSKSTSYPLQSQHHIDSKVETNTNKTCTNKTNKENNLKKKTPKKTLTETKKEPENKNPDFNQHINLKDFDQYNPYLLQITSLIRGNANKRKPTNKTQKRRWHKILSKIDPDGTYWQYLLDQAQTYSFSFEDFLEKAEDEGLFQYWQNPTGKEKTPPAPPAVKFNSNGNGAKNGVFRCSDYFRDVGDSYQFGVMVNGEWDTSEEYWYKDGKQTDLYWEYEEKRQPGQPELPLFGDIEELMEVN